MNHDVMSCITHWHFVCSTVCITTEVKLKKQNNMNTLKFSPARRMFGHPFFGTFPTHMEDMFNGKDYAGFVPSVNLAESEKEWHIELSAPGFK